MSAGVAGLVLWAACARDPAPAVAPRPDPPADADRQALAGLTGDHAGAVDPGEGLVILDLGAEPRAEHVCGEQLDRAVAAITDELTGRGEALRCVAMECTLSGPGARTTRYRFRDDGGRRVLDSVVRLAEGADGEMSTRFIASQLAFSGGHPCDPATGLPSGRSSFANAVAAPAAWAGSSPDGAADYDGDGVSDRYTVTDDGGDGAHLNVQLGSGRALDANIAYGGLGNRAHVATTAPFSRDAAGLIERTAFADALPAALEGSGAAPHPAMGWSYLMLGLSLGPDSALRWTPQWAPGPPSPPLDTVGVIARPGALHALGLPDGSAVLRLTAYGLDQLAPGEPCGGRKPWLAPHGVALYDPVEDRTLWLWVSGVPGVSPAQKLRWRSVDAARCTEGHLVDIDLSLAEQRRVRIDPEAGRIEELDPG